MRVRAGAVPVALLAAGTVLIAAALSQGWDTGRSEAQAGIILHPFITGLNDPVFVTHANDGSGRIYIVEQGGTVRVAEADGTLLPTPFMNISGQLRTGGEQGLLSIAFPRGSGPKSSVYVYYTNTSGNIAVSQFGVSAGNPPTASGESSIITIPHPGQANHNGGTVAYGNDGMVYFATGDGGGSGDPNGNAQNPESMLGKLFRMSPGSTSPEMVGLGLRNPFRFSFDGGTLYIADVGQEQWEEVNVISVSSLSSSGPANFGWDVMEGTSCHEPPSGCDMSGLILPQITYAHSGGACSIIGGYVYRGSAIPSAAGSYVYGDFCTGHISGIGSGLSTGFGLTSFGLDEDGELYVTNQSTDTVYRIQPMGQPTPTPSPTPTNTPASTNTPTSTATPEPTASPPGTGTTTATATEPVSETATPEATGTPAETETPPPGGTEAETATGTPEPTGTPTPVPTRGPHEVRLSVAKDGT